MKKQMFLLFLYTVTFCGITTGQTTTLDGYVFEDNNRGYLNAVEVEILEVSTNQVLKRATTNMEGFFSVEVPTGKELSVQLSKDLFFPTRETVSTVGKGAGEKVYVKVKLERKPGYIFDVTLAEAGEADNVNAITGAKVEVYNNTLQTETLVIESLEDPNFNVTFERGNHYTVMIRKENYFNKRLEAYVDVEGCILCFEGVGTVTPGVSDVMTRGFQMGSVLANIDLESAKLDKTIQIDNIYYEYNASDIVGDAALELDKIIGVLADNPAIIMELGSHTDARGGDKYNMNLSQARAEKAVEYIIRKGNVNPTRIKAKGYGESKLTNNCWDGSKCSDAEHAKNRRTELRIIGFEDHDPYAEKSLADILTEERLMREIENSVIEVPANGQAPGATKRGASSNSSSSSIMSNSRKKKSQAAAKFENFPASDILIVQDKQPSFLEKMPNNELNPKLVSLLQGQAIFMQEGPDVKRYSFEEAASIPVPLLNALLERTALLKEGNNWTLFRLVEGNELPEPLKRVLKL